MSWSRSTYRYERELSRKGSERAMANIARRTNGPERFLSLASQEVMPDDTAARPVRIYMGPHGTEMTTVPIVDRSVPSPSKQARNRRTKARRDRVAANAQALLDELNGIVREQDEESEPELLAQGPHGQEDQSAAGDAEAQPHAAEAEGAAGASTETPADDQQQQDAGDTPAADADDTTANAAAADEAAAAEAEVEEVEEVEEAEEETVVDAQCAADVEDGAAAASAPPAEEHVEHEHVAEGEADAQQQSGPRAIAGFLEKFAIGKSSVGAKNWKRRWFSLGASDGATLTYHEKQGTKPLGRVPVAAPGSDLIAAPTTETHPQADPAAALDFVICFRQEGEERKLLVRCPDAAEHTRWTAELAKRVPAAAASSATTGAESNTAAA